MCSEVDLFRKLDTWRWKKPGKTESDGKIQVTVIGSEGSGKTTLAYSLLGKPLPDKDKASREQQLHIKYDEIQLIVYDTPGLKRYNDPSRYLKKIQLEHESVRNVIFTIKMESEVIKKDSDEIKLIENIHRCFEGVWNQAIIVLTFANELSAKLEPSKYKEVVDSWKDTITGYLNEIVKPGGKVPIIPAGYPNTAILQSEPDGTYWLNDIWLSLLLRAQCHAQPFIFRFVVRCLFEGPEIISAKQLFDFITSHYFIYTKKLKHDYSNAEELVKEVSAKACSYLHISRSVLHYLAIKPEGLSLCQSNELAAYWKNITPYISIALAGEPGSGKTALINSLFHDNLLKESLKESNDPQVITRVSWETIMHNEIVCRIRDTSGVIDESYYDSLKQACSENRFDLVFYCISIYEDKLTSEKNIKNFTECLGQGVWKKTVVVLTFANCLDSHTNYKIEMATRVVSLKKIFDDVIGEGNMPNIAEAGYHNDAHIYGDTEQIFWCANLWIKAITVAEIGSQPALITWLHTTDTASKSFFPSPSYEKSLTIIDFLLSICDKYNII